MRRFSFDPFRFEQTLTRQPAENRIDRAFRDDEVGEGFEMLDDREPIARARGDREEDGQVERAAAVNRTIRAAR